MDIVEVLLGFIEMSKAERKYADSSARGFKAAIKLFAPYLNDNERSSFDVLLQNLDNISNDIYSKLADENFTVTTLLVYKRRIRKLVQEYERYGNDPEAMASWNPRRPARAMRPKIPEFNNPADGAYDPSGSGAASQAAQVSIQPMRVGDASQSGIRSVDLAAKGIPLNHSEISLRPEFKFTLELPVDLSEAEASKIKMLIDLMTVG